MRGRGLRQLDLTVADVERSLAFYRELLGPLGWTEEVRFPSYRDTEEIVYLVREGPDGEREYLGGLGLRPADGGSHRYYDVGIDHFAFEVDGRGEVDEAHERCLASGASIHYPDPRRTATCRATTRSSHSTPMGFESKCSAGRAEPVRR